jgi:xanthine/uracil/vitamin C permease (AzgA family)
MFFAHTYSAVQIHYFGFFICLFFGEFGVLIWVFSSMSMHRLERSVHWMERSVPIEVISTIFSNFGLSPVI